MQMENLMFCSSCSSLPKLYILSLMIGCCNQCWWGNVTLSQLIFKPFIYKSQFTCWPKLMKLVIMFLYTILGFIMSCGCSSVIALHIVESCVIHVWNCGNSLRAAGWLLIWYGLGVADAAVLMLKNKIHRIPIVNDSNQVVGEY